MPFDIRPIVFITGIVLTLLAAAMLVPALVDFLSGHPDGRVFLAAAAASAFLGLLLALSSHAPITGFGNRQVFLLTLCIWVAAALAASLPFAFSERDLSFADAVFEATSGVTATGSSVLHGLNGLSPGLLLWRSMLQWIGGAGILIVAVMVLPPLNIGGMELFRLETALSSPRVVPRAVKVAAHLIGLYAVLSAILVLALRLAGMDWFQALLYAMSTISCGGFSTSDGGFGVLGTPALEWVILMGMAVGGAPFIVFLNLARRRWAEAGSDSQLRFYVGVILSAALILSAWLAAVGQSTPGNAIRQGLFAAISAITGTGYAPHGFAIAGGFPILLLFLLAFAGGCAGSTAGGFKLFRVRILFAATRHMMARLLRPNAISSLKYDGRSVPDRVTDSVLGYLFVAILSLIGLALMLALLGLDAATALSMAVSALANLGPGLMQAGIPLGSYAELPEAGKVLLAAGMLFGRLEMLMILVLFARAFWDN
ncbi:MAG: TrkH family potassium uptake protein [Rhodospirillaceae bacterium]|nr:TrkH family potassium uptake protein [Rhodospirillaceae bacterium]